MKRYERPEPQGEIPECAGDDCVGCLQAENWRHKNRIEIQLAKISELEAALTSCREELTKEKADRKYELEVLLSGRGIPAELRTLREELERVQAALRETREFIENQQLPSGEWSRVLDIIVAALNPVSDRQPEGEKP